MMTYKKVIEIASDPVTAGIDLLDSIVLFGEKLSPEIAKLIAAQLPAVNQKVLTRRLRRCKRHCRRAKFGKEQIAMQVRIDFRDMPELHYEIISLLQFMLVK